MSTTPEPRAPEAQKPDLGPQPEVDAGELAEPTWRELIYGNVRVLLGVAVFAGVAFGIWRLAAFLFPEIGWLQFGDRE